MTQFYFWEIYFMVSMEENGIYLCRRLHDGSSIVKSNFLKKLIKSDGTGILANTYVIKILLIFKELYD